MGDTTNLELSWRSVMMAMVCLPIVICIFRLVRKKVEVQASRVLALTLFVCVLAVMPQIIGFAGFYDVWPGITFFPFPTDLWLGPLIYLHAFLLLKKQALAWRKYLIIPGIIQSAYYTWAFIGLGDYVNKWEFTRTFHAPYVLPVESAIAILMIAVAIVAIWRMYKEYKSFINETESIAVEFDPIWLKRIIIILVLAGFLFSVVEVLDASLALSYVNAFPLQVLIMLSIAWLSVEAVWRLNQQFPKMPINNAFVSASNEIQTQDSGHVDSPIKAGEPANPSLSQEHKALAVLIEQSVKDNQWFLEPRFSLKQLAKHLATNEVYISKAINKGLGLSFNDYINTLRIDYAKALMRESSLPILTIALDSGFNSKATFNRVFKDLCGQTPSQFKVSNH